MNDSKLNSVNPDDFHLRIVAAHRRDVFNSVAFSPDGLLLASGSGDRTVKLWDVSSSKLIYSLEGHHSSVLSVVFSPDGRLLASGSDDKTVKLWDRESGGIIRSLEGHNGAVNSVAFSPDGQLLASGSDDKTFNWWDVNNIKPTRTLKGYNNLVLSVAFSTNGQLLAIGSDDNTIKLWNVSTGKRERSLEGHQGPVRSVAFSPDGRSLASGSDDKTIKLWDIESGKLIRSSESHNGPVNSVAFSLNGRLLASSSDDNTVKLWDVARGRLIRSLERHQSSVLSVAFSPDGQLLASSSDDETVKLWDVALSPDDRPLVAGPNVAIGNLNRSLQGHSNLVHNATFSPNGRLIASGADNNFINMWDVSTGKIIHSLKGHNGAVNGVAFSPDGQLLASGSDDETVRLWNVEHGRFICSLRGHQSSVLSVAFSPDGKLLASGSDDETVRLWNVERRKFIHSLRGHQSSVLSVAFSANGKLLASSSDDKTVNLWNVPWGGIAHQLKGHLSPVRSVAFSHNGQLLASGSDDKTVKLWDVSTRKLFRSLEGHNSPVNSVAYSPDGQLLVSRSDDNTVKLWDVETGTELQTYKEVPPTYYLLAADFKPRLTAAASFGQTIFGDADIIVSIAKVDSIIRDQIVPPTAYISAKVVLIGESNVGKSCLALRLAKEDYKELGPTHGMRTWKITPEELDSNAATPPNEEREIFLWDLGGHHEYRLVNQLFLPETTLAMILLEPTRGRTTFDDVREWDLRLKKQTEGRGDQQQTVKLLVGTKLDTGNEYINRAEINRLINECGFVDFFSTSARAPRGIEQLGKAIVTQIKWDDLSKTTRPKLFQLIRNAVDERRAKGEVVLPYSELERQIRKQAIQEIDAEFDPRSVNTVIGQLAGQGAIADTRSSSGERMLVLQIGYISIYASSLILAARQNSRGVPALEESEVNSGRIKLPRIALEERLNPIQELVVLQCVVQLLLDCGLCLKHERLLIFPSEFDRLIAADEEKAAHTLSLSYDFSGAINNIYASLVTQLAVGERFGRIRLWDDRAEYEAPGRGVCGLRKADRKSGLAHLELLFSEETTQETRALFTVFVEEHLRKEGVTIKEVLELECPSCRYLFGEPVVKKRIDDNHADIGCPKCDMRVRINRGAEKERAAVKRELFALRTRIEESKEREIAEIKQGFKPLEIFFSYSHKDEALRVELATHLSALRRENVIGQWHDRMIGAGMEWKGEIDRHLEQAGIILLLVSPDFIDSDYCYDIEMKRALERHAAGEAVVIPVILRPVDWLKTPIAQLQSLPRDNRAVTSWANRDEAFVEIAKGIRQGVEEILRPSAAVTATGHATVQFKPVQIQQPPIRILHLSDLHFGKSDNPVVRLQPLISDLKDRKEGFGIDNLDYLVISGDLTNRASQEEYERVHEFLSEIVKAFKLSAQRCIIVPGNHDLSWDTEVYEWRQERKIDLKNLSMGSYVKQGDGYLVRDDKKYHKRFENFARFYHQFTMLEYPLKAEAQCLPIFFEDTRIQFLAMNSAWLIDEFHPERSGINEVGLAKGLIDADRQIEDAKKARLISEDAVMLRIAIWHHPATGNEKIAADDFLERLRKADIKLCLHGHVHEDRADLVGYLHPTRQYHIAGAGSFGAVAAHRPPSTPKLYNLIEIPRDHSLIRIHTRCMRKENGAWEGWAVWPSEDAFGKQSFYEIKLK